MIAWQDEAVILSYRRHGETAAILEVMTRNHGRHLGVVAGGASRKNAPRLQPGQHIIANWKARLETHIGSLRVEVTRSWLAALLSDAQMMGGFQSIVALLHIVLAERDPHPVLYDALLHWLESPDPEEYAHFELLLLREAGFRLDLSQCAVSGARAGLAYISPKTGAAVTRAAAGVWADRLLPYAPILVGEKGDIADALHVTGYFLENWVMPAAGKRGLPEARHRYVTKFMTTNAVQ